MTGTNPSERNDAGPAERGGDIGAEKEADISFRDVAPAIEFACWIVVALAPFLRWVNGAAVTDDQFAIQVALVFLALCGAPGLRVYNWRARKRAQNVQPDQSQRE